MNIKQRFLFAIVVIFWCDPSFGQGEMMPNPPATRWNAEDIEVPNTTVFNEIILTFPDSGFTQEILCASLKEFMEPRRNDFEITLGATNWRGSPCGDLYLWTDGESILMRDQGLGTWQEKTTYTFRFLPRTDVDKSRSVSHVVILRINLDLKLTMGLKTDDVKPAVITDTQWQMYVGATHRCMKNRIGEKGGKSKNKLKEKFEKDNSSKTQ